MKKIGIIAEYNPFHEGHRYLAAEAKRLTGAGQAVAVMSGDFTQRGFPAVFDKWTRAEAAVKGGMDLVLELPVCCAAGSAEYFAEGGVRILEGMGCLDYLAFGSESGSTDELRRTARLLSEQNGRLQPVIREKIKEGMSYPRARAAAMRGLGFEREAEVLGAPNNILGVEYIRQLKTMDPVTVKRTGESHHESASRLRAEFLNRDRAGFLSMEKKYFELVCARILQTPAEDLERVFSSGAGLGYRLKREVMYAKSTEELIDRIKSKAYTRTRVSRLLLHTLLGITDSFMAAPKLYIRVLAFNKKGGAVLREMRQRGCARLPVLTNINKERARFPEIEETLEKDILAADLYNLICGKDLYAFSDHVKKPFILTEG